MVADLLWTGPETAPVLVLAHGAGAPMDSAWMNGMAALLADRDIRVVRFEFPYMAARREGRRPPAPRAENVAGVYREVVAQVVAEAPGPVVIGGKSMGGRVASMVVDELDDATGLVCLGYPFHPAGDPTKLRTAHLEHLRTSTLICQGTRDPFGTLDEVLTYPLPASIRLLWLEDGEHGFVPRTKLTGLTAAQHLATVADTVSSFVRQHATR